MLQCCDRLSVWLSVVCNVCIVAKRCVLLKNCLKKQISLLGIEWSCDRHDRQLHVTLKSQGHDPKRLGPGFSKAAGDAI